MATKVQAALRAAALVGGLAILMTGCAGTAKTEDLDKIKATADAAQNAAAAFLTPSGMPTKISSGTPRAYSITVSARSQRISAWCTWVAATYTRVSSVNDPSCGNTGGSAVSVLLGSSITSVVFGEFLA